MWSRNFANIFINFLTSSIGSFPQCCDWSIFFLKCLWSFELSFTFRYKIPLHHTSNHYLVQNWVGRNVSGLLKRSLFYLEMVHFHGYLPGLGKVSKLKAPWAAEVPAFNKTHFQILIIFYILFLHLLTVFMFGWRFFSSLCIVWRPCHTLYLQYYFGFSFTLYCMWIVLQFTFIISLLFLFLLWFKELL